MQKPCALTETGIRPDTQKSFRPAAAASGLADVQKSRRPAGIGSLPDAQKSFRPVAGGIQPMPNAIESLPNDKKREYLRLCNEISRRSQTTALQINHIGSPHRANESVTGFKAEDAVRQDGRSGRSRSADGNDTACQVELRKVDCTELSVLAGLHHQLSDGFGQKDWLLDKLATTRITVNRSGKVSNSHLEVSKTDDRHVTVGGTTDLETKIKRLQMQTLSER